MKAQKLAVYQKGSCRKIAIKLKIPPIEYPLLSLARRPLVIEPFRPIRRNSPTLSVRSSPGYYIKTVCSLGCDVYSGCSRIRLMTAASFSIAATRAATAPARLVADGRAHFRGVVPPGQQPQNHEHVSRAPGELCFSLTKDLHGSSAVSRVSTTDLLVISTSVFETASLRVGRPSAHRQTVRLPVRLACLNGSAREKSNASEHGSGKKGCDAACVLEIVALAGTNKIVIGMVIVG